MINLINQRSRKPEGDQKLKMIGCSVICGNAVCWLLGSWMPYGWVEGHVYYKALFCGVTCHMAYKFCSLADFKLCWKCWYVIIRSLQNTFCFFGPWANASVTVKAVCCNHRKHRSLFYACRCNHAFLAFRFAFRIVRYSKQIELCACLQATNSSCHSFL